MEPFLGELDDGEIKAKFKLFLNYIDRTIADGYCHANLGPIALRSTRLLLECEQELLNSVPNFTIKYDLAETPDELMEQAILCALECANPVIANHQAHKNTYWDYGISSCYNVLPLRGRSYTLSRVVIPRLAKMADSTDQFLTELLPDALLGLGQYMDERIRFLVEESGFFQSSFLVHEGLLERENFTAMFGVAGLCDGVNYLLRDNDKRYGRDPEADDPAAILDIIKGAFTVGDKYLAIYRSDSDLVRITGYLAKRSDIEKYDHDEVVLQDTVQNGSTNYKLNRLSERKVRSSDG